jgi:hypothetical protein
VVPRHGGPSRVPHLGLKSLALWGVHGGQICEHSLMSTRAKAIDAESPADEGIGLTFRLAIPEFADFAVTGIQPSRDRIDFGGVATDGEKVPAGSFLRCLKTPQGTNEEEAFLLYIGGKPATAQISYIDGNLSLRVDTDEKPRQAPVRKKISRSTGRARVSPTEATGSRIHRSRQIAAVASNQAHTVQRCTPSTMTAQASRRKEKTSRFKETAKPTTKATIATGKRRV